MAAGFGRVASGSESVYRARCGVCGTLPADAGVLTGAWLRGERGIRHGRASEVSARGTVRPEPARRL